MTRAQVLALALVLIAGLGLAAFEARGSGGAPAAFDGAVQAHRLPALALIDDRGAPLRLGVSERGAIVVLGFTQCTDQCPVTLAKLAAALRTLDRRTRPRAVFVTVDPAHDDPATLHRYLAAWGNSIAGATGEPKTLARLLIALGAGAAGAAARDHDTRVFAVDRSGDVRAELDAGAPVEAFAEAGRQVGIPAGEKAGG